MTNTSTQHIAFFGATGGCTNACLVHTLNAGFHATALARTPSKLVDMLHAQGITQDVMDAQLTIFKGDISDIHAIKDTLTNHHAGTTGAVTLASQIISGIGGTPQMQMSLRRPVTIDNPEICATATKNIITALQEIYKAQPSTAQHKPSITVISTTGVSDVKEDVPFGFRILYHVVLADPHKDKKVMERLVTESAGNGGAFSGAVIIRPSLLTGDQSVKGGQGWEKLRVGQEEEPAVGYTVHRADVGQWIFEQVVKTGSKAHFGKRITLTN
ncbi:hypothetical protein BG015_001548 [Linnemannia schmuckeri]|uniref:NAD(P)-binding domain-containing protein n=1 Tax=Linnemannia schmuckeri TaxID=64567 RepID=A0A9P5V6X0_9FUNG|nr:hypothetical protein BG015_001548 [Linnemannia schmuckeri]